MEQHILEQQRVHVLQQVQVVYQKHHIMHVVDQVGVQRDVVHYRIMHVVDQVGVQRDVLQHNITHVINQYGAHQDVVNNSANKCKNTMHVVCK